MMKTSVTGYDQIQCKPSPPNLLVPPISFPDYALSDWGYLTFQGQRRNQHVVRAFLGDQNQVFFSYCHFALINRTASSQRLLSQLQLMAKKTMNRSLV